MGAFTNIGTAFLISRVKVQTLAVVSALITLIAPILMATVDVGGNYWFAPFWALFLSPVNPDGKLNLISQIEVWCKRPKIKFDSVLFTVSNLVISDAFPSDLQSLAGGVFNEVAQFGNSVGLAATAAIAASVTEHSGYESDADALMRGYRAAYWTIFAGDAAALSISYFGLRKAGTIGKKDD
jgi:hypothetical protein